MDKLDLAPLPLALRLKLLRIYAGWPVSDAAEYWGKSVKYVYRREAGTEEPSPAEVDYYYQRAIAAAERYAAQHGDEQRSEKDRADVRSEVGEALEARARQRRGQGGQSRRRSRD